MEKFRLQMSTVIERKKNFVKLTLWIRNEEAKKLIS